MKVTGKLKNTINKHNSTVLDCPFCVAWQVEHNIGL